MTRKSQRSKKYVSDTPLACYRSGITHPNTYGVLVLVPGHQNCIFGYYLASERQIGVQWVYEVHAFTPRLDAQTYQNLLEELTKQAESNFANV